MPLSPSLSLQSCMIKHCPAMFVTVPDVLSFLDIALPVVMVALQIWQPQS